MARNIPDHETRDSHALLQFKGLMAAQHIHNWIVFLFRFIHLSHDNSEIAVLDIMLIAAMRVETPAFNPLIAPTGRREEGNSGLVFRGKKYR